MTDTLLLDADIIAFKVASVSQRSYQWDPEGPPAIVADDWEEVVPRIDAEIAKLTEKLRSDRVIVCLSCPTPENWRLGILPTYKGNRDYSKRPVHLQAVKDYLEAEYPSYRRPTLEADDIMGILSTMPGLPPGFLKDHPGFDPKARKVIVSEDKDMKTIPGWLFNPAKDSKPWRVEEGVADYWHAYQTLVGDATDGYAGCPGIGPKKADKALNAWVYGPQDRPQLDEWWDAIKGLYESRGLTEADALVQARVARICRFTDYDFKNKTVIPWTPKTSSGASSPRSLTTRPASTAGTTN